MWQVDKLMLLIAPLPNSYFKNAYVCVCIYAYVLAFKLTLSGIFQYEKLKNILFMLITIIEKWLVETSWKSSWLLSQNNYLLQFINLIYNTYC